MKVNYEINWIGRLRFYMRVFLKFLDNAVTNWKIVFSKMKFIPPMDLSFTWYKTRYEIFQVENGNCQLPDHWKDEKENNLMLQINLLILTHHDFDLFLVHQRKLKTKHIFAPCPALSIFFYIQIAKIFRSSPKINYLNLRSHFQT